MESMLAESKNDIKEKEGKFESLHEKYRQVVAENAEKAGRLAIISADVEEARRLREDIKNLQEQLQTERVSSSKKFEKFAKEKEVSVSLVRSFRYHYACAVRYLSAIIMRVIIYCPI